MTGHPLLPPVALVTYSTKPRGGVAHTLALGEALNALGQDVVIVGLGDPAKGFFRPVAAPTYVIPAPTTSGGLEEKVAANIDAIEAALAGIAAKYPILHTQDCISARAAARVRDAGVPSSVVRTVHHVDDFDSPSLMDCQTRAILEPDRILVVTRTWERILRDEYGVSAAVVPNGVDLLRYREAAPELVARLRARVDASDRPMLLAVGGIEPRKGTDTLVAALSKLIRNRTPAPVLAVVGGHSFQDHRAYRDRVLASLDSLDLTLGKDIVELGTVPEEEMAAWYAAADVLAFPSVKEGFGLAALEAMAAGVPVVTSDLPVFREWLVPGRDALLVPIGDADALADALADTLDNQDLRARLRSAGLRLAEDYTWTASARRHLELYAEVPLAAR
ncbi:MSMEG_0565 family glycosyltransferase [Microbispora hainanensis]|uniref:MSMEG_0565 family glycosyltransferase n=1 Tax=Microbispora hainanensis TaxID=568844 RepID=A0A544YQM3_9ACTN|nr:MSMEG_0565 family glycosyltransferase [Microbispora hainanensis]TQS19058.1 MSMEG_0565 family glycosyltransferase [Microbispora hainanensis]